MAVENIALATTCPKCGTVTDAAAATYCGGCSAELSGQGQIIPSEGAAVAAPLFTDQVGA